jgi:hypothetical protein
MPSACALSFAAVGVRRTKLQLLQPMAGLIDNPLSLACAGAAASTAATAPVAARVGTVSATVSRGRASGAARRRLDRSAAEGRGRLKAPRSE